LRPIRLKEWLIVIISFFLPFFFLSTYEFWNYSLVEFWQSYFNYFKNLQLQLSIDSNPRIIVLFIFTGILLFLSLLKLRINYLKNVIRTRSYQQIFFILLVFCIGLVLFSNNLRIIHFSFLMIPMSVFCSYYFLSAKKRLWLYEYAMWVLIGIIIWNHLL
jgi:hypothetical protein